DQMLASIKASGLLQPPLVREDGEDLVILFGHRRVEATTGTLVTRRTRIPAGRRMAQIPIPTQNRSKGMKTTPTRVEPASMPPTPRFRTTTQQSDVVRGPTLASGR